MFNEVFKMSTGEEETYEYLLKRIEKFTKHNNDFKTKLEYIHAACNDKRVSEIQGMIGELLEVINNGKTPIQ